MNVDKSLNLKELQAKQNQAQTALTHYSEQLIDYVDNELFTGKEILDMLRSKQGDPKFDKAKCDLFAGVLMEIIKGREVVGT